MKHTPYLRLILPAEQKSPTAVHIDEAAIQAQMDQLHTLSSWVYGAIAILDVFCMVLVTLYAVFGIGTSGLFAVALTVLLVSLPLVVVVDRLSGIEEQVRNELYANKNTEEEKNHV